MLLEITHEKDKQNYSANPFSTALQSMLESVLATSIAVMFT